MSVIGTLNIDNLLNKHLGKSIETVDCVNDYGWLDGIIIDWIPTKSKNPKFAPLLLKQTSLVEKFINKKIPILIFDRYMGITKKEASWLRSKNVILFEPCLNHRHDFIYLPFSTELKKIEDIQLNDRPRNVDLVYKGYISDKLKTFETYYVRYGELYPSSKIYYDSDIEKVKEEEYDNYNVTKKDVDFSKSKAVIALGSRKDYRTGFFNPIVFEALNNNCIVFVPYEHRYFRGISQTAELKTVNYWVDAYEKIYSGVILDTYENIRELYPEFGINYTVDVIKYYLRK